MRGSCFPEIRNIVLSRPEASQEKAAELARPELLRVSAGFDAHTRDSIGSLGLETEDYTEMTRFLLDVAHTHCHGRLVSCLEGGYDLVALAESVETHFAELLDYRR